MLQGEDASTLLQFAVRHPLFEAHCVETLAVPTSEGIRFDLPIRLLVAYVSTQTLVHDQNEAEEKSYVARSDW